MKYLRLSVFVLSLILTLMHDPPAIGYVPDELDFVSVGESAEKTRQEKTKETISVTAAGRSGLKVIARDGDFISYENGIVEDTRTGLEWVAGLDKNTNWNSASSWVSGLNLAGGDWRMPTRVELKGLYQKGKGSRNMTPLLKTTGWWIWSGEKDTSSSAWGFTFFNGNEDRRDLGYSNSRRAFAVRSRR